MQLIGNLAFAALMGTTSPDTVVSAVQQGATTPTDTTTKASASAQAAPAGVQGAPAEPPANTGPQIGDVIVTANRRAESLQSVPVSVSAITQDTLRTASIDGIRQLTSVVPGYYGGRNNANFQPAIRGVSTTANGPGEETNVSLYVDGVYQPESKANMTDFVRVDRIEVLRGPQGTLFGRNATGGLINIITPDPQFTASGSIEGEAGVLQRHGAGRYQIQGYVTGPLAGDVVAADLAVMYRANDGYLQRLARSGYTGNDHVANVRGKLLFQPSSGARIIFTFSHVTSNVTDGNATQLVPPTGVLYGVFANLPRATQPWQYAGNVDGLVRVVNNTGSIRTSFDLGGVSLETTTGLGRYHALQISDSDFTAVTVLHPVADFHTGSANQEIRLLSTGDTRFKWIAGLFGIYSSQRLDLTIESAAAPTFATLTTTRQNPRLHTKAYAAFAEGTYGLTEALKVTAGVRYNHEERDFLQVINGALVVPKTSSSAQRFTYRGIVNYELAPRNMIYASYSTGFKSGTYNGLGTSAAPTRPETINAIEIGAKTEPLPWLRANASVFHYDYNDLQVSARLPNSVLSALINAAQATVKGGELEVQAALPSRFNIGAAVSVLDAKYKSFPGAVVFVPNVASGGNTSTAIDAAGNRLVEAPAFTFSTQINWTTDVAGGDLRLGGSFYHSARVFYEATNRNQVSQKPYSRINLDANWSAPGNGWGIRLYVNNLTNEAIAQQFNISSLGDSQTFERPREIGAGLRYNF